MAARSGSCRKQGSAVPLFHIGLLLGFILLYHKEMAVVNREKTQSDRIRIAVDI